MTSAAGHAVIGVTPARDFRARVGLFNALELAYPVRFEARDHDFTAGLDGLVQFPDVNHSESNTVGLPRLRYWQQERPAGRSENLHLTPHKALDRPLRDSMLSEKHAGGVSALGSERGAAVLATIDGAPVWTLTMRDDAEQHEVAIAPAELASGHALRSRLTPNRCLAVLALAQFVRNLASQFMWHPPGLRAAFLIDDPNLRRPTYGYIDYAEMAASAKATGYHVSIAMVPREGRFSCAEAVQLFRDTSRHMSLCIHGNNHQRDELHNPRSIADGSVPVAQAIRRSIAFERRTGLPIDRVMVAPHERLGHAAAHALVACGFEAFSGTRPYPWLPYADDLDWLSRPADAGPLVGWRSAEIGDGLPALLRLGFSNPDEELVFRAFLGQPLIMYGHADLFRRGPGDLEQAAATIARLGDVHWRSLAEICRGSIATRRRGSVLELQMLGRRVGFEVPDGISEVVVDTSAVAPSMPTNIKIVGRVRRAIGDDGAATNRLIVEGAGRVELILDHSLDPMTVPAPSPSVRSVLRRFVAEGRDRAPLLAKTFR
jgi:hypothetical protein